MGATGQLAIRVLGATEVETPAGPRDLPSRRQRALLAALAVRSPRPVPVNELIDAVWDDEPPDGARTTLQTYVSRVRRQLGDVIEHTPGGYRLDPGVMTDIGEARAAVRQLERLDHDDHRGRAELALGVLEFWRGPVLAEFGDTDWFRAHVVELDEMRANLIDVAAEGLIHWGRAPQAVSLLEVSLADGSLREPTHVLLVHALHAAGRTTEAMRAGSRYRRRLRDETGLVPGTALTQAEQLVLSAEPPPHAPPPESLSPMESATPGVGPTTVWSSATLSRPTPLVGRSHDLDALHHASSTSRLVTITGVGGVGKTRLVAELIERRPHHSDVLVVELAPVTSGNVVAALGAAVGIRSEAPELPTIVDVLRHIELLVVLDNAEHVTDEVRAVTRAVLDACRGIRIVVTSRRRLELPDEIVVQLAPLRVDGPDPDAVTLFVDRLNRARPGCDTEADRPTIGSLCRRLDGIPLALELAASRAAALGVPVLHEHFDTTVGSMVGIDRDGDRHATLGNVVAWSVDLLDEPARDILVALSVFRGEFDLDDADAVGRAVTDEPIAPLLGRLIDASLVTAGARAGRYRLLAMIGAVAGELLESSERLVDVRQAHASWAARQLEEIADRSAGPDESTTQARLHDIRHEVVAALQWAMDDDRLDTAARLVVPLGGPVLYRPDIDLIRRVRSVSQQPAVRGAADEAAIAAAGARAALLLGQLDDVDPLAARALNGGDDGAADPPTRHRAHHAMGVVRLYQGRFADSLTCFQLVLDAADATIVDRLDSLGGLALAACYHGKLDEARNAAAEHRAMSNTINSDAYRAFADYITAEIHLATGDVETAGHLLTGAAERAWEVGATFIWGIASTVLASVLVRHRPPAEARRALPTLIERWRRTATWPQLWTTLRLTAEHLATEQPATALLILESADRDPAAPALAGDDRQAYVTLRRNLQADLGDQAAAGILRAAAALDRGTVVTRSIAALTEPIAL